GESLSSIMQKESSQHLFTLQDSQLDASEMRAELWGASASLIQCNGLERSIISGLRVSGNKLKDGITNGAAFEVTLGELVLIDVKVERVIMIQNDNERNSDTVDKVKSLGLIVMKDNAKLLRLEKCLISNINMEDGGSAILSNGGINSRLQLGNGLILKDIYTPSGGAIIVNATGPSSVIAEGVILSSLTQALYVNMKTYNVSISFKRCVFASNTAPAGGASNVFIKYENSKQRISTESFLGCHAIASTSIQQEKSICYAIGNATEMFIDERELLHTSWQSQSSDDIVWFIANEDASHQYNENIECNNPSNPCPSIEQAAPQILGDLAKTIQFCEGVFKSPKITAQGSSLNIIGYSDSSTDIIPLPNDDNVLIKGSDGQSIIIENLRLTLTTEAPSVGFVNVLGQNSALILQKVQVRGHLGTEPPTSTLEPEYLFNSAGIVYLEDVVIQNIFLKRGSIILAEQARKTNVQGSSGIEWLGLRLPGIYSSYLSEITTNESRIISIQDSPPSSNSISNENNKLQSNADSLSFIIQDSIFSKCASSVNVVDTDTETKGGIIHILSKGVTVQIINSDFRRCTVLGRNMIYIGWNGTDSADIQKVLILTDTFFTGCTALVPGMRVVPAGMQAPKQLIMYNSDTNNPFSYDNELYANNLPIYDDVYKHGLIYLESLTAGDSKGTSPAQFEISGIYVAGCHSAVGSGITTNKITILLIDSDFLAPLCCGNVIYMNQTIGTVQYNTFQGRASLYQDPLLLQEKRELVDPYGEVCPGQPYYYSSSSHGLVYVAAGTYTIDGGQFEETQVGGIKVDSADAVIKGVSFVEPAAEEGSFFDGSLYMIMCIGPSNLDVYGVIVNGYDENSCQVGGSNEAEETWGLFKNDASGCNIGVVSDEECHLSLSEKWVKPGLPNPVVSVAKVKVNISDDLEPLRFEIGGENYIPLMFTAQISEIRAKTLEEIHEEVKQNGDAAKQYGVIKSNYRPMRNSKFIRNSISEKQKKLKFAPHPLTAYEITNEEDYPRDKHGRIIWPPEDATPLPITVPGEVRGMRKATFSMADYTWMDSRNYFYGVTASNDKKVYAGENGEEGKPVLLDVEVLYGEQFLNLIEILPPTYWWVGLLVGPFIVLLMMLVAMIWYKLKWRDKFWYVEEEQYENKDSEVFVGMRKKQKTKEKFQAQQKRHQSVLVEYKGDVGFSRPQPGNGNFNEQNGGPEMTEFAKGPSKGDIKLKGSLYQRPEGKMQTEDGFDLYAYTDDLRNKLDDFEDKSGVNTKGQNENQKVIVEMPKQEKGTLNQQIADFFTQVEPQTIDFSAMNADDPQLRDINWGAAGPPATIGLGEKGISRPPKELFELQKRQEKLLSKSTTGFAKVQSKRSSQSSFQGRPMNPPMPGQGSQMSRQGSASTTNLPPNQGSMSRHDTLNGIRNHQMSMQSSQQSIPGSQSGHIPKNPGSDNMKRSDNSGMGSHYSQNDGQY
ncbi:MAG: hypothetical protein EZS28_020972, partial [Streblomastix strix]